MVDIVFNTNQAINLKLLFFSVVSGKFDSLKAQTY